MKDTATEQLAPGYTAKDEGVEVDKNNPAPWLPKPAAAPAAPNAAALAPNQVERPMSNVDMLANLVSQGERIPAGNSIGMSSGVFTPQGRELTAGEANWQLGKAASTAAWYGRMANTALRRAATADDPRLAYGYLNQARAAELGQANMNKQFNNLNEMMAGSALDQLLSQRGVEAGGSQAMNELFDALRNGAQKGVADFRRAPGEALRPHGNPTDNMPIPEFRPVKMPTVDERQPRAPWEDSRRPVGNRYEYRGYQAELPSGVDLGDPAAVSRATAMNNMLIDWMFDNDEEEV